MSMKSCDNQRVIFPHGKAKNKIVFLCGARDFHAMDWYRSAVQEIGYSRVSIVTDLISGEGFKKLVSTKDDVNKLLILDNILFRHMSKVGDVWRNVLKMIVLPIQVFLLKRYSRNQISPLFFCHGMYYMFLAALAKVPYVGTPQGSEILVRPQKSILYKKFAAVALKHARFVTVDSVSMKDGISNLCGVDAMIVQNGIDIAAIQLALQNDVQTHRTNYLSIRGFYPLYRILELLDARNNSIIFHGIDIRFAFPFSDSRYLQLIRNLLRNNDKLLYRLERKDLYKELLNTKIVFSIPLSDSSPRSVYESIFLGCVVIVTYNEYINVLPNCMRKRVVIADLKDSNWFDKSMKEAECLSIQKFEPTDEAIDMFDQSSSFMRVYSMCR